MRTCLSFFIAIRTHGRARAHTHSRTHALTHAHTQHTHTHTHTHTHIHTHSLSHTHTHTLTLSLSHPPPHTHIHTGTQKEGNGDEKRRWGGGGVGGGNNLKKIIRNQLKCSMSVKFALLRLKTFVVANQQNETSTRQNLNTIYCKLLNTTPFSVSSNISGRNKIIIIKTHMIYIYP